MNRDAVTAPVCARAVFLVAPEGFGLAAQSASDNTYMNMDATVDAERALRQHRALHRALAEHLPVICFAGNPATPDAVFPNNVFATVPGRLIIGHMRHPVRQAEADRDDIRSFFRDVLAYAEVDLRQQPGICELTGSMVIDRGRGIGFCGLSERCDPIGAEAMREAFGLRHLHALALAPGEYHANVVLSVLASRVMLICPEGFSDPEGTRRQVAAWGGKVIELGRDEKDAFAANCIALDPAHVFMSERAADSLHASTRAALQQHGLKIRAVALDEIEKAGGSLRCCVAELF